MIITEAAKHFASNTITSTIFKSFARSHFDYCDTTYDQSYITFHQKMEPIQNKGVLTIKGAISNTQNQDLIMGGHYDRL